MVEVTKNEYEASECLARGHTISIMYPDKKRDNFYICSNCHPHQPNSSASCEQRLRERCKEFLNRPSAEEILNLFLEEGLKGPLSSDQNENRRIINHLFCSHFGRCWECTVC